MDGVYVRSPDFVQREVAGEFILVPLRRRSADANSIYVLNETAAGFWRRLDGRRSVPEIAASLTEEYAVEPDRLRRDLAVLIRDLIEIKAIACA